MVETALTWQEWGALDGVGLSALVQAGEISGTEIVRQAAHAVARVDGQLASVIELFDAPRLPPRLEMAFASSLYAVPILLKDLGARLEGRVQESGSAFHCGRVSTDTDPFVRNLQSAGLVPIGRSATSEFGLAWDTSTQVDGTPRITRNPYDTARTPGGSSGGSAAIVAAGAVPIASTSDGGGSTRIPASHCGLVGLKPTRGLCPRPYGSSEYLARISTDGVVTRSVRDTAAVLDHSAQVSKGGSFMPVVSQAGRYLRSLETPLERLRIGLSFGTWGRSTAPASASVERTRAAAHLLEGLGHEVIDVEDREIAGWAKLWESYTTAWMSARIQLLRQAEAQGLAPTDLQRLLTPMIYRMVEASQRYDAAAIYRMMALNNEVTRSTGAFFDRFDVLLTPSYAAEIPDADGVSSSLRDGDLETWFSAQLDRARYAILANEVGIPAISLPTGLGDDGLPIGVQICGSWCAETTLLRLAAEIETSRPAWFAGRPAIHVANGSR